MSKRIKSLEEYRSKQFSHEIDSSIECNQIDRNISLHSFYLQDIGSDKLSIWIRWPIYLDLSRLNLRTSLYRQW